VVREMELDFAVVECQAPRHIDECVIAPCCRLQVIMDKAVHSFLDVLDQYTLADLLQNATRLRALLKIDQARPD
jgi:Rrf2 family nitric oxide-sensitive transcriptional repressor